jgi:8-oxo-dGTP pyrophosphatase MutT (NUDIX family)
LRFFLENLPTLKNLIPNSDLKISAVIFGIFKNENSTFDFLITKRSPKLKSHSGQLSFPGGKVDDEDESILKAALREWEEELGESTEHLEILTELDGLETGTGYHITPFLAEYKGNHSFSINPNEVESIYRIPFQDLENSPFYSVNFSQILNPVDPRKRIHYFQLKEGLLWGATCEIILRFLENYSDFKRKPISVFPNIDRPPFFNPSESFQFDK